MSYIFPVLKDEYKIGVISDTHGLLRPEAINALYGSDIILHAGDIGDPEIITRLNKIAPVRAVRGNVDTSPSLYHYPFSELIEIGSIRIFMIHNISDLDFRPSSENINIVIYGHSHKAAEDTRDKVLFFNPGSAGKRRFHFPITTGEIKMKNGNVSTKFIELINS